MGAVSKEFLADKTAASRLPSPANSHDLTRVLFHKYNGALHRFMARNMARKEDVSDMVQEVYLRIVRYQDPAKIKNPQAFLFTTASNLLKDRSRRNRSRAVDRHVSLSEIELTSQLPSPESVLHSKQVVNLLAEALTELKPEYLRAFVLHRFRHLTYDQIAVEMGISSKTVEKYMSRALNHCRERILQQLWLESTGVTKANGAPIQRRRPRNGLPG